MGGVGLMGCSANETNGFDIQDRRSGMKVRLLGRVEVMMGDPPRSVYLSPQLASFLAVLLLAPERTADPTFIGSYLWPGRRATVSNSIQKCVSRLRDALGYDILQCVGAGAYRLVVNPKDVDLYFFLDSLEAARRATGAERATQFEKCMSVWGGPPLAGVNGDFWTDRERLVETWKSACLEYVAAACEAGAVANIETHLPGILQAWSREPQYASVVAEVREAYEKHKAGTAGAYRASASQVMPRQLPAHRTSIIGRDGILALVDAALIAGSGPRICVLTGAGGVGKSLVALRWAETRGEHFPDGVLYFDLNGFSAHKAVESDQVLTRFLNDLDVDVPRLQEGLAAAFRTALAGRALLVVLDNARDAEQVRPLLPGSGSNGVIITSRRRLTGFTAVEGASAVDVPRLNTDACTALFGSVIGSARMNAEPESAHELVRHCAGLPLAVIVLGSRIAARNVLSLANIVAELRSTVGRLESFVHDEAELNVRAVFESTLAQLSPHATALFWKFGVHRGPSISRAAVEALSGLSEAETREAVAELRSVHVVEEVSYERYAMHDLLRDFAQERALVESDAERRLVVERILDHLIHNARACDRVISPVREVPVGGLPPGIPIVTPVSPQAAMDWFDAEYEVITAAVDQANSLILDHHTWLLPVVVSTYQWRRSRYLDASKMLKRALQAAERVADSGDIAMVLRMLAGTDRGLGRFDHAKLRLADAIALCDHGVDPLGFAHSSNALAVIHREIGETDLAESRFKDALAIYRNRGDAAGVAVSLNGIGCTHFDRNDLDKAADFCEDALEASVESADENGRANIFDSLADIALARQELAVAVGHFRSCVEIFRRLDYKLNEAQGLVRLANAFEELGDRVEVRSALARALELFEELSHPSVAEVATRLRNF